MSNSKTAAAIESIKSTRDWIQGKLEQTERQLKMNKNCLRSHNCIIGMIHVYEGEEDSNPTFMKITDRDTNSINFSADAFDSPRYVRKDAEAIAANLSVREGTRYVVLFDNDAMKAQAESWKESIEAYNKVLETGEF